MWQGESQLMGLDVDFAVFLLLVYTLARLCKSHYCIEGTCMGWRAFIPWLKSRVARRIGIDPTAAVEICLPATSPRAIWLACYSGHFHS